MKCHKIGKNRLPPADGRAEKLPESPKNGLSIKVGSNFMRLHDRLLRSGYQRVCTCQRGRRTVNWLIYKYAGVSPAEA